VGTRLAPGWEAAPDELARLADVVVSSADGLYLATIVIVDERGEPVTRAVRGSACSDVVDGMTLVTALAIRARVAEAFAHSEALPPPAKPAESSPVPAPAAPRAVPSAPSERIVETVRPKNSTSRVSGRAALTTGVGPGVAPGGALGIVLERGSARVGVAVQGFKTGRLVTRGTRARFELLSTRLEGCPWVLALSDWASIEPCPFADLGSITGEAIEDPPAVIHGERGSALWLSAGGLARAVGGFGAVTVELEGLGGFPLRRERFYLKGGEVVYRVPIAFAGASVGLGVRF
jgi:hypothetical protein